MTKDATTIRASEYADNDREVNDVEGAWVESETTTYSVAYEAELQELAEAFGYDDT